jgi:hypothetical protein
VIPLLGIYPKEIKSHQKYAQTPLYLEIAIGYMLYEIYWDSMLAILNRLIVNGLICPSWITE